MVMRPTLNDLTENCITLWLEERLI